MLSNSQASAAADSDTAPELFDVLIVGAGLSGIGAAARLSKHCPTRRYAIIETRAALGGTWDLFRYPGVRSDSDMYTLGYGFKPWTDDQSIVAGSSIRDYIRETAEEYGVTPHIRYGQKVLSAAWSSADARWTIEIEEIGAGARHFVQARFLSMCSGYYSYEEAFRPSFDGEADFKGRIVQPQFWPEDLDYAGKQVVVVGSGATAITVVPAMAETAAHVTMLQRSPSYVLTRPGIDGFARFVRRALPEKLAYTLTRLKNVVVAQLFYKVSRTWPGHIKRMIIDLVGRQLRAGYDVKTHFTPKYAPWDQRVCMVPDGDMFRAIRQGRAAVVTDHIERFTSDGIRLASGAEIVADIVVMATGLKLKLLGGIAMTVDGVPVEGNKTMVYKGMMLSEVPNLAIAFGYTNSSWTLKADLTANYVCRLLNYMQKHGHAIAMPRREDGVAPQPFLDLSSGYVQRSSDLLPSQGDRRPWRANPGYFFDVLDVKFKPINDGIMRFGGAGKLP